MHCAREVLTEEDWLDLADRFGSAAALGRGWTAALSRLATACGADAGHIVGLSPRGGVSFHWSASAAAGPSLVPANDAPPLLAPLLPDVLNAPLLKLLEEERHAPMVAGGRAAVTPSPRSDSEGRVSCQTPLIREQGLVIVLGILRPAQLGPFTRIERNSFISMAPHVRAAVQTQMVLEGHDMDLLAGAMEALSLAAFVCDRSGEVRTMTEAAKHLLADNRVLRLRQGRFEATLPGDTDALRRAVQQAAEAPLAEDGSARIQSVILRNGCGPSALPVVLDVIALPRREYEFTFAPRVLVVVRGSRKAAADRAFLLHAAFGLTAAEAEVALLLAEGQSVETIALRRCVSESTVRSQVKNVFSKLGVNRQIELAARLSELR